MSLLREILESGKFVVIIEMVFLKGIDFLYLIECVKLLVGRVYVVNVIDF